MTTRLAIATLVAVGLAATPFAAQAKKHRHIRHHISTTQSDSREMSGIGMSGLSTTRSGIYGTSGSTVGTVTAPSVGSYYWPSVGVTNAVPTWSNTNPSIHR
jgi:hypothetical protein